MISFTFIDEAKPATTTKDAKKRSRKDIKHEYYAPTHPSPQPRHTKLRSGVLETGINLTEKQKMD